MAIRRRDIFLDFLSSENAKLYATYYALPRTTFVNELTRALNVAVLLCGDRCLLPPFFPLQWDVAREVLERSEEYLAARLVVFPLRELLVAALVEKKRSEYGRVRGSYEDLFDTAGERFLIAHASAIIHRDSRVGETLAERFESGPDVAAVWKPIVQRADALTIESVRKAPLLLKDSGQSVTWSAMQPLLPGDARRVAFEINQALQHEYMDTYLSEYDAAVITRLPPKTTDLLLGPVDLSYDYLCFESVLRSVGVWPALTSMPASVLVQLRFTAGYLRFIDLFTQICSGATTLWDVTRFFASAQRARKRPKQQIQKRIDALNQAAEWNEIPDQGAVDVLEYWLHEVADAAVGVERPGEVTRGLIATEVVVKNIFLIHGRDKQVRDRVELFLRQKGLNVVVMENQPWGGLTIPEKFEQIAQHADFVVAVATPDDDLTDNSTSSKLIRFRQNVTLEIGYFWGRLGRARFALLIGNAAAVDIPSDLSGLGYIEITPDLGATFLKLESELRRAGIVS